jgi:ribokinase
MEIVVVGSLNSDLVVRVPEHPGPGETVIGRSLENFSGGKGANQAFAAARLGGRVAMAGCVGADASGRTQLNNLAGAGVDVRHVVMEPSIPTGTAFITVQDNGENRIIVAPGANQAFTPDKIPLETLRAAKFVLLQMEIPWETVQRAIFESKTGGARVILDPAPAPAQRLSAEKLAQVDYLTPNLSELAQLSGINLPEDASLEAVARAAQSLGGETILVKLGPRGILCVNGDGTRHLPAFAVEAVDTTAAGDCFNAAFAVALSHGSTENEAIRFAQAAAALSVTRLGAQASMPDVVEVEDMLRTRPV